MSLRAKLLLPLLLIGLLMGAYLYAVWIPRTLAAGEAAQMNAVNQHLESVTEGLIPLLLGNQLDIIHENLTALKAKNATWVEMQLVNAGGKPLYPVAGASQSTEVASGPDVRLLQKPIGYLGMDLGKLGVKIDLAPTLASARQANRELTYILFGILLIVMMTVMLTAEIAVRRPLRQLADAARRLAHQDFDTPLPGVGRDEVGALVDNFATMRDDLLAYHNDLRHEIVERAEAQKVLKQLTEELQAYRDQLEEQVERRTEELSVSNIELRETNRQLGEVHSMLLQAEKMASLGQLAAGVAHEINNPIGFVNSNLGSMEFYFNKLMALIEVYARYEEQLGQQYLEQVAGTKRDIDFDYILEDLPQLLKESRAGLDRVKKIVQDLGNFSHLQSTEWQAADLHGGLESTLNIMESEIGQKAIVLKEYGTLPEVECLPGEINQVFMNLLLNAVHAIDGKGEIRIKTSMVGEDVCVAISDNGCGISPENLKHIFDPFFTTKPVGSGTGLGLSLAYAIVKKHHGRIEVQSAVGSGSTFLVYLPKRQPQAGLSEPAVIAA